MTRRRGAFKADTAKGWLLEMLEHLPLGITVDSVVVVCDNAPCHSKFEECVLEHPGLTICRLGPYSPMLNPVATIWSKMKAVVKQRMRVPDVQRPGVGEQRLQYVEALIDEAMDQITVQNIMRIHVSILKVFSSVHSTWKTCLWGHRIVRVYNTSPYEYYYILL